MTTRIAIVGMGFMGQTHLGAWKQLREAEVTALVSKSLAANPESLGGAKRHFQEDQKLDISGIDILKDLDSVLTRDDIDLIDVCLPTSLHFDACRKALEAGKHVLVEKPITLQVSQAKELLDHAEAKDRLLLVAHVLKFFPEHEYLIDTIKEECYGKVRSARFKRLIAKPDWRGKDDLEMNGGPLYDLHIHDVDLITHAFGAPDQVQGFASRREGIIDHIDTRFDFGKEDMNVSAEAGWLSSGLEFEHGYDVCFEQARLIYDSLLEGGPRLYTTSGKPGHPELSTQEAFVAQAEAALSSIAKGRVHAYLDPRSAISSLQLCHDIENSLLV